ncbi:hypothetical protein HJC23_005503 [Cyclotella cryptica]|uniref:Uncharacterized protein n=1 Tax=Cyclotella cryptica TaxID=29204 RepID=A0ABD3PGX4_9STRA
MKTAPSFLRLPRITHLFLFFLFLSDMRSTHAATHQQVESTATDPAATLQDRKRQQRRQLDKQRHKRKHDLSHLAPHEIATKSDEELLQLYHEQNAEHMERVEDMYGRVLEKLKEKGMREEERRSLVKRREMLEERRMWMEREKEKKAKKVREELISNLGDT